MKPPANAIQLTNATLTRGPRTIWHDLDFSIQKGEFVAVLGPNGAGKTTLLKVLLGLVPLSSGDVSIFGQPAHRGNAAIGYIPQQRNFDRSLPVRGRDLVQLGIDGSRYGVGNIRKKKGNAVQEAINAVGAAAYANQPIGLLSGGEQQRLRIAQALVGEPALLLCDEPLLSLDVASQATVTELIDEYRRRAPAAVIFVTHEINPVLQYVDKVLYLANGSWVIDTPDVVLQSETLSKLYDTPIEVLRLKNRVLVVGADEAGHTDHHHDDHKEHR